MAVTRWWGDVGTHLFYRRGGSKQFVGIEVSFPLTPRATPVQHTVHVEGAPTYKLGVRTMVANAANLVQPRVVRELRMAWDLESQVLNAGRLGPEYVLSQLPRMRQSYFSFGVYQP